MTWLCDMIFLCFIEQMGITLKTHPLNSLKRPHLNYVAVETSLYLLSFHGISFETLAQYHIALAQYHIAHNMISVLSYWHDYYSSRKTLWALWSACKCIRSKHTAGVHGTVQGVGEGIGPRPRIQCERAKFRGLIKFSVNCILVTN